MSYLSSPRDTYNQIKSQYEAAPEPNYADNPDGAAILKDPRFLEDLRAQYGNSLDDEELVNKFYADQTWGDLNTFSAAKDALEATTASETERARLRRLQQAYRNLPWFFQEGGRGIGAAVADAVPAILADPINLIPGVNAYAKAVTAGRAAQAAGRSAARAGLRQGAKSGAKSEAIISAGQEAAVNTAQQARDVQLGLQDEFSQTQLLGATAVGGVIGGGVGGVIGGGAGIAGGSRGAREAQQLADLGYSPEDIARMAPEQARTILSAGQRPDSDGEDAADTANETTETDAPTPEAEEETPEQIIDREFADVDRKISANVAAYRQDIDNLIDDGADPAVVDEAKKRLLAVRRLARMTERLKRERSEIDELGETNDVKALAVRDRRLARFEEDFTQLRALMRQTDGDGDPDEILARIQRMREAEAETPEAPEAGVDTETEVETEAPDADETPEPAEPDAPAAEAAPAEDMPTVRYGKVPRDQVMGILEPAGLTESDLQLFIASGRVEYGSRGSLTQRSLRQLRSVVRQVRDADTTPDDAAPATAPETPAAADEASPATPDAEDVATPDVAEAAPVFNVPAESRGAALAAGIDYRKVQPPKGSKTGRVTKRAINKAIRERGEAEPDEYAALVQDDLDSIISKIGVFEDDENLVREIISIAARDPDAGVRSDAEDLLALFDDLKRKADADAENISVSSRESTEGTTKTYDQALKRRIRVLKQQNPDLSDDAVRQIAAGQLAREESAGQAGGNTVRNTATRTEDAAQLTTAGRTNTGRIQSFLRRGTRIGRGSDYTTTGGNQVRPNEFGFEAALIKARTEGNSNVQPYVLSGRQKVMTREGEKTLNRGDTAFADGVTGRAYDSQELALEVRGEGPSKSSKANTDKEDTGASAQQIRELLEQYRDSSDPRGFLNAVAAIRRGEAVDTKRANREAPDVVDTETVQPEAIPLTRGDKLLIVRNRNNPDDVRMISPKQADAGGDITKIIGKNGAKSDPANWEARYAPRNSYVANRGARRELFDRLENADAGPAPQPGALFEAGGRTGMGRPLSSEELAKTKLPNLNEDQTAAFSAARVPAGTKADGPSLQDLVLATHRLEISRWSPTREAHQATSKHLRTLYELMDQEAPQGYLLPNEGRQASVDQVRKTFEAYTAEELDAATDLIQRLGGDVTVGPRITNEAGVSDNFAYTPAGGNAQQRINLDPKHTKRLQPRISTLYHEVAHWAYFNILTPQDRAEFWRAAEGYYGEDGRLNRDALDEALGVPGQLQVDENTRFRTNTMESPQELFANQFELWAMRTQAPNQIGKQSFWRKITSYVQAIFDRYYKNSKIDPNLEPLFAKILPPEEANKVRLGVDAEPATDFGRNIQKRYVELQQLRADVNDAFARDSADAIITAHGELVRYLLSIAPRGSTADRPNTGAFAPVRRIYKMIHQRIDDIDEIVAGKPFDYQDMPGGEFRTTPEWMDMGATEVADPQAVADLLRDHYLNGYAGQFQPTNGVPGQIKNMNATSVNNLLTMVETALEGSYRSAESGNMVPGHKPRLSEDDAIPAAAPSKAARRQKTKRDRRNNAADREARKTARTPASKRNSKPSSKVDPASAGELKTKDIDTLRAEFIKHRGTQRGDQIAVQLLEKEKAAPLPPRAVPITEEIRMLNGSQLRQRLLDALENADSDTVDQASYELRRRQTNKGLKEIGEPTIRPTIKIVTRSLQQEQADNIGLATNDSIPPSARASVREMLSYLTHRDPEAQHALRTMTYRMINLLGKTARGTLEDTNVMTTGDVARLAGVEPSTIGNAVFADMRAPEFRALRRDMRRMSIGLTKGNVSPRDLMHEIGHVIARSGMLQDSELDAIRDAYRLSNDATKSRIQSAYGAKYADRITASKDDLLAEEWFAESLAEYMSERVAKTDVLRNAVDGEVGDLALRGNISRAIDRATEYVAYLINGLVGRNDIKQQFRRLFLFGDMHSRPRQSAVSMARINGPLMSPHLAQDAVTDSIMSSPAARLQKIRSYVGDGLSYDEASDTFIPYFHGTPRGDALRQETAPEAFMRISPEGNFGPGVYLADNPHVASEVYSRRPTARALEESVNSLDLPAEEKASLIGDVADLQFARRQLANLRVRYAEAINEGLDEDTAASVRSEMDELVTLEQDIQSRLIESGVTIDPLVLPLYTNVRNPADFRESAMFESVDEPMIRSVLDHMNMTETLNNRAYRRLEQTFADGPKTGADAYKALVNLYRGSGRSEIEAKRELNETLEDLGYDGLLATHRNTMDAGGPTMANGNTYQASTRSYDGLVVFDNRSVKHVDAAEFDAGDQRIYYREGAGLPQGEVGSLADDLINESVESLEQVNAGSMGESLEAQGASPSLTDSMMAMLRGRKLGVKEEQALRKQSPMWFLQSQASRMRDLGARWVGGWYKEHFPAIHSQFAGKYMPIHRALRALPDADGKVRAWAREATGGVAQAQPKSYSRIVRALRRGEGSRSEKALSEQERAIYNQIRSQMAKERQEMISLGLHVGDRGPNYLPQVWNKEKIRKNQDQFLAGMEQYYLIEKTARGQEGSSEEAAEFAKGLLERLAGDESDGAYVPVRGGSRSTRFENVDYSRVIELEKYPEAMRMLEDFLDDDLENILVKYFEGSTRKISHAKQFGVNNHGFYDYLMVADQGADGITRLLSQNKTFRRDFRALSEDGYVREGTLTEQVPMPFEGDETSSQRFVQELVQVHNEQGSAAARKMLEDIAPTASGGVRSETYARRVDAIVGALDDYKGRPAELQQKDYAFLESAMDVAMKKPMHGTGGEGVRNFSKFMRSFNNVSLLGFTTLTSLGDVILPIIRSPSMKNYTAAMRQFASDPEYRRMIENTGIAMETIVHERMIHMYGAVDNKLSNAFFNATMLTPWTDLNRKMAGAIGYESFKAMQTKAVKNYKSGLPIGQQSRQYKEAARFLNRYGLGDYLPTGQRANESLSNRKLMESDEGVRTALIKFADDSIFTPNPNDIPLWAQTPWGAMIFQLKSFPLMMARLGRDAIAEAKQGNVKPLATLATLGPAFGAGAMASKDIIQMRGGEDGRESALRERSLSNILEGLGYNADIHGSEDEFMGWYVEGMMQMGGLGLLGDIAYSVATQLDNGSYGEVRIGSTFLGPSFGAAMSGVKVASGITDSNPDSNAKERAAAREVATRIPVLGGVRSFREAAVDRVAGPSSRQDASIGQSSGIGSRSEIGGQSQIGE